MTGQTLSALSGSAMCVGSRTGSKAGCRGSTRCPPQVGDIIQCDSAAWQWGYVLENEGNKVLIRRYRERWSRQTGGTTLPMWSRWSADAGSNGGGRRNLQGTRAMPRSKAATRAAASMADYLVVIGRRCHSRRVLPMFARHFRASQESSKASATDFA